MKKQITLLLLLAIMMVPTAQSQKVATVKSYTKKEFRFDGDTIKRVTVKVVKVMTIAPKPDNGFRRSYDYGKPKDTTYTEYEDIKVDSVFAVKNYGSSDFGYFSPDYYTAYSKPNQKIFAKSPVHNADFTIYSNYFLTKEEGAKDFYVVYYGNLKAPYFELGFEKHSEKSLPWIKWIIVLFALSFCGRKIARFSTRNEIFKTKTFKGVINSIFFLIVSILLFNGLVMEFVFSILFDVESYNQVHVPYDQVLVVWFARCTVLLLLVLYWNIRESQIEKANQESTSENQIDKSAGSEQLN